MANKEDFKEIPPSNGKRLDALEKRFGELEERVEALLGFEQYQRIGIETPEYINELMVATINSLYNQRSQGAYNMAKRLEEKYFEGKDLREIGDRFVVTGELYSGGKEAIPKEIT